MIFNRLQLLKMYLRGKWYYFKYCFTTGTLFSPGRYYHTNKSRASMQYCLKILEQPDYKYTTYSEQMLYNELLDIAQKYEIPITQAAYEYIELMIGFLGFQAFN